MAVGKKKPAGRPATPERTAIHERGRVHSPRRLETSARELQRTEADLKALRNVAFPPEGPWPDWPTGDWFGREPGVPR
jgi:hypothetical protein